MYGATKKSPLLPSQSKERRRDFRLRRQNAQRSLTIPKEQPGVFKTVFREEPTHVRVKVLMAEISTTERTSHHARHSVVYTILNERSHSTAALWYKRFISSVILLDLVIFILSTDESKFTAAWNPWFHTAEGITSCIFLVEYVARLWTCTENHKYRNMGPVRGRLAYACTWPAVVDFLATTPFFLELATGWDLPRLTYLRFFRLCRILKTSSYIRALDAVYRVVYYNREILWVAALLCFFLILVTGVLLYYLRPAPPYEDNEDFGSILATLYLSTLMLTGQGGPGGDLPWYTKAVVLLTSVFSVAMFAIPASMLTWGFEAEAQRMAKSARRRALKRQQREEAERSGQSFVSSSSSYESSSDGDTTDEEYLKIIAGEDDGGDDDDDDPWTQQLKQDFGKADEDADGNLTLKEFLLMQQQQQAQGSGPAKSLASVNLERRVQALETKVEANNAKLDRILELLEQQSTSPNRRKKR